MQERVYIILNLAKLQSESGMTRAYLPIQSRKKHFNIRFRNNQKRLSNLSAWGDGKVTKYEDGVCLGMFLVNKGMTTNATFNSSLTHRAQLCMLLQQMLRQPF